MAKSFCAVTILLLTIKHCYLLEGSLPSLVSWARKCEFIKCTGTDQIFCTSPTRCQLYYVVTKLCDLNDSLFENNLICFTLSICHCYQAFMWRSLLIISNLLYPFLSFLYLVWYAPWALMLPLLDAYRPMLVLLMCCINVNIKILFSLLFSVTSLIFLIIKPWWNF